VCFVLSQAVAGNLDNYLDLAAIFKENGEYQKAIEILEPLCRGLESDRVSQLLGRCYYLKGKAKVALNFLNEKKNKDWHDYLYLGLVYEDLNKMSLAQSSYLESIKIKKNSISLYRLGKIYFGNGQYKKAISSFRDVLDIDSSIKIANYYLGLCYLEENDFKEAYNCFLKTINFYPNNIEGREKMEIVKKKLGEKFFSEKEEKKKEVRQTVKFVPYKRDKIAPMIKVAVAKDLSEFTFKNNDKFFVSDGGAVFECEENKFYKVVLKKSLTLCDGDSGRVYQEFSWPLKIYVKGSNQQSVEDIFVNEEYYPFYILDLVYGEGDFWHKQVDMAYRGDLEIIVNNDKLTIVNLVSLEDYLYGVLSAEIPAASGDEALAAQAVAARTIAFRNLGRHRKEGYDFCADVHCQVYKGISAETPKTTRAVWACRGQIMVCNGEPIEAFYHANCGGCLCSDVFGQRDYLVSKFDSLSPRDISEFGAYQEEEWFHQVPDTFCQGEKGSFRWQRIYDEDDFAFTFGFPLSEIKSITFLDKGDGFRYKKCAVSAKEDMILDRGLKIRNYFDKLRGSAFKLEEKFSEQGRRKMLIFWGAGFGHGAGLCQEGAINQAKKGYKYKEILQHYYPNTRVKVVY